MATPLVSGSISLLLNKYGDLSPAEIKAIVIDSCIDLKEAKNNQGSGMLNLKLLFNDGIDESKNKGKEKGLAGLFGEDMIESLIFILIIIFLLDSRF